MNLLTQIDNYSIGLYLVHSLMKWIFLKITIFDSKEKVIIN